MKAAVFEGEGRLVVKDMPKPQVEKDDQVVIKIETCSVCGTDVHMTNVPPGYPAKIGTILGHELVGSVTETGKAVTSVKIGDRVVVNPNDFCGVCDACKANLPNMCASIKAMGIEEHGGFAEYVRTSEKTVFKIPVKMDKKIAAFAEPLACALNAIEKVDIKPGQDVVVLGAGPIGLMFLQLVKISGAGNVISVEPNQTRREMAIKCGADHVIDPFHEDGVKKVLELTGGRGADHVFDVVGSQLDVAIECVAPRGRVVLFGNNARAVCSIVQSKIIYKEAKVIGTWLANATFPKAVKLLESGLLKLEDLVTHEFDLKDVCEAIDVMRKGKGIEVLVNP